MNQLAYIVINIKYIYAKSILWLSTLLWSQANTKYPYMEKILATLHTFKFQTIPVLSQEPDAKHLVQGEKATVSTLELCPEAKSIKQWMFFRLF